jgi:tRNA-specific 2-thiouridylase
VRLQVKVRYRNPAVPAVVAPMGDGGVRVTFEEPQRAIARGQFAAFYDGEFLVGGGVISE